MSDAQSVYGWSSFSRLQMAAHKDWYKSFILQNGPLPAHLHAHVSGYLSIKSCGRSTDSPIISSWLPERLHLEQGEVKDTGQPCMAIGSRHLTWHPFIQTFHSEEKCHQGIALLQSEFTPITVTLRLLLSFETRGVSTRLSLVPEWLLLKKTNNNNKTCA